MTFHTDQIDILQLLLDNSDKFTIKNFNLNKYLEIAASHHQKACFKVLLKNTSFSYFLSPVCFKGEFDIWFNIAQTLNDICRGKEPSGSIYLAKVKEDELEDLAKDILKPYLIKNGYDENYRIKFEKACIVLPPKLVSNLLKSFDQLTVSAQEDLIMLESSLIHYKEGLGLIPYKILLARHSKREKLTDIELKLWEFYDKYEKYQTSGNYFLKCFSEKSLEGEISELDYLMLMKEDIKDFVIQMNKSPLPFMLTPKFAQALANYKINLADLELRIICKQQDKIDTLEHNQHIEQESIEELEEKNHTQAEKIILLESKMEKFEKMFSFLSSFPGMEKVAEHMQVLEQDNITNATGDLWAFIDESSRL